MTTVIEVVENPVTVTVEGETVTIEAVTEVATVELSTTGPQGATGPHLPTFSRTGLLTPTVGSGRYYLDAPSTVTFVRAAVGTAPVGASLVVGVNVDGVQQTTVTILAGQYTGTRIVTIPVAANGYLTVDILSVGSSVAGSDLTVTLTIN